MVAYPFSNQYNSPNRSPRQNVARKGVVLHHAAGTSYASLHNMMMGAKQVSATGGCKDERIDLYVPNDNDRPWSLSSSWGDSAFRSVETANESTNGWTISDASHWSLARAVAYWAEKDGFYPHRNGPQSTWTVIGHREVYTIYDESYATACPGGMDLNLVTARAQQILGGSDHAGGGTIPIQEEDDEMKTTGISWVRSSDGKIICALVTPGSGYWSAWEDGGGAYNGKVAVGFDTGDFVPVSESHARNLESSAREVRKGV